MPSSVAAPRRAPVGVEVEDGPMGAFGVEPRIEMAADTTAHIVFVNSMAMTCM